MRPGNEHQIPQIIDSPYIEFFDKRQISEYLIGHITENRARVAETSTCLERDFFWQEIVSGS